MLSPTLGAAPGIERLCVPVGDDPVGHSAGASPAVEFLAGGDAPQADGTVSAAGDHVPLVAGDLQRLDACRMSHELADAPAGTKIDALDLAVGRDEHQLSCGVEDAHVTDLARCLIQGL
jgi:hypothetical protein